jgi:hypothetical protein
MKITTTANDIRATLAERRTRLRAENQRKNILVAYDHGDQRQTFAELERATAARTEHQTAQASLKKIPAPRRKLAQNIITIAEKIGMDAAKMGEDYSGDTTCSVRWGQSADAITTKDQGEQYSRKCTYKKTNADHTVFLDPAGAPLLVEAENLRNLSARDGLRLIALYPSDAAVWVKNRGKAIVSESGWIVGNGQICYHSTVSREHAQKGFAKKHAAHLAEIQELRRSQKQERRVRLIARLCGNAKATLADALALGYCTPGIQAFQAKHGIGDETSLPALISTGNAHAVRLALNVARKITTNPQ